LKAITDAAPFLFQLTFKFESGLAPFTKSNGGLWHRREQFNRSHNADHCRSGRVGPEVNRRSHTTEFANGHANPYAIVFLHDLEAIIEDCNNVSLSENPRDELIYMLNMTCMYSEFVIEHRILFQYMKQILELCDVPIVHAGSRDEIPAIFRSDVRVRVLATLFATGAAEYIYGVEQINFLRKKRLWAGNDRTAIDFEAPQNLSLRLRRLQASLQTN
jgi:hypothetical protein